VDAAIIGPRRPSHLDAALEALTIGMPGPERSRIADLFAPAL